MKSHTLICPNSFIFRGLKIIFFHCLPEKQLNTVALKSVNFFPLQIRRVFQFYKFIVTIKAKFSHLHSIIGVTA